MSSDGCKLLFFLSDSIFLITLTGIFSGSRLLLFNVDQIGVFRKKHLT